MSRSMNKSAIAGIIIAVIVIGAAAVVLYNRSTPSTELTATPDLGQSSDTSGSGDVNSDTTTSGNSSDLESTMPSTTPDMSPDLSPSPSSLSTAPTTGVTKDFTVTASNYSFTPNQLTVKQGDTVRITFKNTGGTHSFNLDQFKVATKVLSAGQQETVQFVADTAGQFQYYCNVANHRQMGMVGTLTVQ